MNPSEAHPIDITGVPEILRIVEEVRTTNSPRVLRRDCGDVAILRHFTKDDPVKTATHREAATRGQQRR